MSISTPFIHRPVATTLLTIAVGLSGAIGDTLLPVSPLPQVDFPTLNVTASLPGGSPEVMAASVATPLEKMFTRIAGVTEMTSSSSVGSANVTLQFDLSRDINAAARDVQAAINAAAPNLPANLPLNPTYRKINPADAPIMVMSMQSDVVPRATLYDIASSVFAQKLAQVQGVGQVQVSGSSLPAVRAELNPQPVSDYNVGLDEFGTFLAGANALSPVGEVSSRDMTIPLSTTDQLMEAKDYNAFPHRPTENCCVGMRIRTHLCLSAPILCLRRWPCGTIPAYGRSRRERPAFPLRCREGINWNAAYRTETAVYRAPERPCSTPLRRFPAQLA